MQFMEKVLQETKEMNALLMSQLESERRSWEEKDEKLRAENDNLRQQLLYAMSQIKDGAGSDLPGFKSAYLKTPHTAARLSSEPSKIEDARKETSPSWAQELRAAIEAVDHIDVLSEDINYQEDYSGAKDRKESEPISGSDAGREALSLEGEQIEPPPGPPPELTIGADDIFWVNKLHNGLINAGYYPGEDDIEDFYFGDATLSALQTMQACLGLPESGIVDESMWFHLLGPEVQPRQGNTEDQGEIKGNGVVADERKSDFSGSRGHEEEKFHHSRDSYSSRSAEVWDSSQGDVQLSYEYHSVVHEETDLVRKPSWPVLMEGDGGKEVHSLHVALQEAGFAADEDDIRWWHFGDTTLNAVKTFQACQGIPESGICDDRTWKALLGSDSNPEDLFTLRSGLSDDEDLADGGAAGGRGVWLIGEQRWEDRSKLGRRDP